MQPSQTVTGQSDLLDLLPVDQVEAVDPAAARARRIAAARAELERRACWWPDGTRVEWVAPWDCGDGTPAGTVLQGWRCWHCGQIEVNQYMLAVSHGLVDYYPESLERVECARQILLASQARARSSSAT